MGASIAQIAFAAVTAYAVLQYAELYFDGDLAQLWAVVKASRVPEIEKTLTLAVGLAFVLGAVLGVVALAGPKRSSLLPDVPTLEEAGIKGVEITQWYALFAPGKTPRPVIDLLNKTLNTALADKDVVRRIEEQGAVVDTSTPEQLALTVKQELAKWKGVVVKAQLTPD